VAVGHGVLELARQLHLAPRAARERLHLDLQPHRVALAAQLSVELEVLDGARRDRLDVAHHRLARVGRALELALEAVDEDFQVQLAHAGKDRLARLLVLAELAGRVLGGERLHRVDELVLVGRALRLDGHEHDGLRRGDALEVARLHLGAERIARRAVLEADDRADVARAQLLDLDGVRALLEDAAVDAHEKELAHVGVGRDLEDERRQQLLVVLLARHRFAALQVGRGDGRTVARRRQVGAHRVEERLHALVPERRAAENRHERARDHAAADRRDELVLRQVPLLQKRFHHAFVEVGDLLHQFRTRQFRLVLQLGGDVAHRERLAVRRLVVDDGLHLDQVDDALKRLFAANRQVDAKSAPMRSILLTNARRGTL